MTVTYNEYKKDDILQYLPDLKKFIRSKVVSDWWEDVLQDTVLYLFVKWDDLIITELKGLVINTAKFFINKLYDNQRKFKYEALVTHRNTFHVTQTCNIKTVYDYSSDAISDSLCDSLKSISKNLFVPFSMQMDDMSIKQISTELGVNENTVKTRIKRCKEFLKSNA